MMKHILLVLFCLLTANTFGQHVDILSNDSTLLQSYEGLYDVHPQFPGGQDALLAYLKNYTRYPKIAEHYGVEGQAIMSFIVDTDGHIKEISANEVKITKIFDARFMALTEYEQKMLKERFARSFARSAYRVIKAMPKWKPGLQKEGNTMHEVPVKYTLPITFSM
ncbi:MAG: TonB-dependent receptor [Prevotella sp.]|nr:TonB-dependent receptor [Prevotella sp.]